MRGFWIFLTFAFLTVGCEQSGRSVAGDREIASMAEKTTASIDADARAAALAVADRSVEEVSQTFRAIELAREVVLRDLRHADATGYKTTIARIDNGRDAEIQLDVSQGSLKHTGRPLDVAIQAVAFFSISVDSPPRTGYTRNGNLFVNNSGELVVGMGDGYQLKPPVRIGVGVTDISIDHDGTISVLIAGDAEPKDVGKLPNVHFPNPEGLEWFRESVYLETEKSGKPIESDSGLSSLIQGFLESSNVNIDAAKARLQFLDKWEKALSRAIEDRAAR